jgi:hypothetical protein
MSQHFLDKIRHKMTSSEDFQSPYPPPPLFYKLYTKENLARGTEGKAFELEGLVLPSLDPPPPISGEYECFGIKTSVMQLLGLSV